MNRMIATVSLCLAIGLAACSDEEDVVALPRDGGAADASAVDGAAVDSGAVSDAGPAMCKGQVPITRAQLGAMSTAGKCSSVADLDTVCRYDIGALTGSCGVATLAASRSGDAMADPAKLRADTLACVKTQLGLAGASASDDCLSCYGAAALCALDFCLDKCLPDPSKPACVQCQVDHGCTANFLTCSGLPRPSRGDGGAGDDAAPGVDGAAPGVDAAGVDAAAPGSDGGADAAAIPTTDALVTPADGGTAG